MKTRWFLSISAIAVITITSACTSAIDPKYECDEVAIIPGECIKDYSFEFNNSFRITGDYDGRLGFMIELTMKALEDEDYISAEKYRIVPKSSIIDGFGADASNVRVAYENIYTEYRAKFGPDPDNEFITTVYYRDGLVITADKEFAGIPAGENLASILRVFPDCLKDYTPIPTIDAPQGYYPLKMTMPLKWWIGDLDVVEENVHFEVEMPVKVGLMLTLLRDRLTNPDAEMQFRDEVLTGSFTLPRGLH